LVDRAEGAYINASDGGVFHMQQVKLKYRLYLPLMGRAQ
jgi:hypothetical protein